MSERISVDEYFLKIALVVAERSTCLRHHVGCVAVKDKHIISTGYNGAAAGIRDCLELGCLRDEKGIASGREQQVCRAIHAEQNAIIQAALHGKNLDGVTMYCTHSPCIICAKMMTNAKIKRYVTFQKYADDEFMELFKEAGIQIDLLEKPSDKITFKP